jgi:polyisoprenoid-binding protein YceI
MFKHTISLLILAGFALAPVAEAETKTYTIDASHSEVSFRVKHLETWVRGQFDQFEGTIVMDTVEPSKSSVAFTITAESINTFNADRDNHLRNPDFFDVAQYPTITFTSTSVRKSGDSRYLVTGDFSMHGVTKAITLPVSFDGEAKDPWGGVRAGFSTETAVDRKDYGIVWNKALDEGGFVLGDDVKISINIEAIQNK